MMRTRQTVLLAVVLLSLLALPTLAQESRGTILGTVRDAQQAVVPGTEIVVTNIGTNRSRTTVSNDTGYWEVPFLDAGDYRISAELPGFRKYIRSGVTVNVAAKVRIDIQLEVGEVQQIIEVTGAAPLLDTTSASAGRIIDGAQIASLPFSDLNPFALTAMAPGMQWTGQPEYRRPFDNGGTSAYNTAGGVGQNEYTIDGAAVTGTDRRVGFVPPADAVQEFNLQTSAFDASVGHTSGAVVNVMSRTGTNQFHGSLYDQHWQQRWNATPHSTRLAWERDVASGKITKETPKQAPGRSNQFGATLGGPVRVPWLYNGTDKFFFFFSYNGIYQKKAETTSAIYRSVPHVGWRDGDFSDMLAIDPAKYQIYDPRTARLESGKVVRDPFVGNKGIPVLNPLYQHYVKLYPMPNNVPGVVTTEGRFNYYATNMPKDEKFNSILNRYDYSISDNHRINGKWFWNHRLADEYDWTYETARGLHTNGLVRINKGGSGDWTWTMNNNNIFQLSASWSRFSEGSDSPERTKYRPTDVGLPNYLDDRAADYTLLPGLDFDHDGTAPGGVEDISAGWPAIGTRGTTGELKAAMVTISGNHSFKYGWQERRYWTSTYGPGNTSGRFTFRRDFMRKDDADNIAVHRGLEWASFMMGLPTGISIDRNDSAIWSTRFRSLYFHDDWRVSPRMTLNLGLRYEREGGITERFNRGMTGGFDPALVLPISAAAEAAYATVYAANPNLGLLPPAQFKVLGGTHYLGEVDKGFTDGTHQLLPRFGAVYRLMDKTVLRLGYGWYFDTLNSNNTRPRQDGYSQGTSTTITNDRGLSFCCGVGSAANMNSTLNPMRDPFPVRADGTRFDEPYGNALGSMIRVGRDFNNAFGRAFRPALQHRWRLGIQHELGLSSFLRDTVVEASYNGARARGPIGDRFRIDALPEQYWAKGNSRQQAVDDDLNKTVANPFHVSKFTELQASNPVLYKFLTTQSFFTSTTIRKHQLLRPFGHFNNLQSYEVPGFDFDDIQGINQYHDVTLQFERRMSAGFQTAFAWTRTFNAMERDWRANEFDRELSWRPTDQVRPNRLFWQAIVQMPFGRNGRWAKDGFAEKLAGGWEMSWIWQWQDGTPLDFGNRFFYGDMNQLKDLWQHKETWSGDVHRWFSNSITWNPKANPAQAALCPAGTNNCDPPSGFVGFEGRTDKQPGAYHVRKTPGRFADLRGPGIDNWDIKVMRRFRIREQMNTSFSVDLLNAFNHTNFGNPTVDPTSGSFGQVGAQRGLSRVIQFNLRLDF
jgi:hypothetical protein